MPHPGGRPTKYKKRYCRDIIKFFDIPRTTKKTVQVITKAGLQIKEVEIPTEWPMLSAFAHKIGVSTKVMWEWTERHEEFRKAVDKAKELQENFLVQNGLSGFYQPNIFALVATNFTSMKNKETKEHTGLDGGPIETKITIEFVDSDKDSNT